MNKLLIVVSTLCLSVGCESHRGPETTVWLQFEQGDSSSRFMLAVTNSKAFSVSSEGPLENGKRLVGQRSSGELSDQEFEAEAVLFQSDLLSQYEANAEPNTATEEAVDRRFIVMLDAAVPQTRAPRTVRLGFSAPTDTATQSMLTKMNELLRTAWARGDKQGPNPGLVEPWAY